MAHKMKMIRDGEEDHCWIIGERLDELFKEENIRE